MWKARSTLFLLVSFAALVIIAPDAGGATSELESLREELQKTQADFQKQRCSNRPSAGWKSCSRSWKQSR